MPKQAHDVPGAPPALGPYSVATEANGFVFVSASMISWRVALTASQLMSRPDSVAVPPEKNFRSATCPRGVSIHFSDTARLTVAT